MDIHLNDIKDLFDDFGVSRPTNPLNFFSKEKHDVLDETFHSDNGQQQQDVYDDDFRMQSTHCSQSPYIMEQNMNYESFKNQRLLQWESYNSIEDTLKGENFKFSQQSNIDQNDSLDFCHHHYNFNNNPLINQSQQILDLNELQDLQQSPATIQNNKLKRARGRPAQGNVTKSVGIPEGQAHILKSIIRNFRDLLKKDKYIKEVIQENLNRNQQEELQSFTNKKSSFYRSDNIFTLICTSYNKERKEEFFSNSTIQLCFSLCYQTLKNQISMNEGKFTHYRKTPRGWNTHTNSDYLEHLDKLYQFVDMQIPQHYHY